VRVARYEGTKERGSECDRERVILGARKRGSEGTTTRQMDKVKEPRGEGLRRRGNN